MNKTKIILTMIMLVGIFLCNGCVALIEKDANEKHITGFGIDVNFYPFPSIRIGYYDYILKIEK